ncbi:hypothetical protein RvY_17747-1 [Ramazzottius varieornatus]|uniref:Ig-like domain-containing protein n=1 Tax=Ramazzottius varieornatus TaxID=947166 RepID=A0A1D1W372_RAMVA|nr:hypothetical protein RvY_17747-1 [Ramazzottius varieornatus]
MREFTGGNAHRAPCHWEWILKYSIIYFVYFSSPVFSSESVLSNKASAVHQECCWSKYDDVASKAYAAPIVVRAFCMVIYSRGNLAQFNATFYVNRVLKAEGRHKKMLERSPKIDLNFGMDEDQLDFRDDAEKLEQNALQGQTCLIPRVDLMKEYLLFLRPVPLKRTVEDLDNEVVIEEEEERTGWRIFAAPEISNVASIGHALKVFKQARRPSITKLRSTEVKLDERLSLLCRAKGFPPPKILWYKNGVNLEHPPSRRGLSVRRRKRSSTIRVRKASLRDAGIYRCVAVNVLGSVESEATVNVSVPTVTPPVMTLNPVTDSWVFQGIACQERDFCLNDGICKFYPRLNARSCKCPLGYHGTRCESMLSLSEEKYFLEVRRRKIARKGTKVRDANGLGP